MTHQALVLFANTYSWRYSIAKIHVDIFSIVIITLKYRYFVIKESGQDLQSFEVMLKDTFKIVSDLFQSFSHFSLLNFYSLARVAVNVTMAKQGVLLLGTEIVLQTCEPAPNSLSLLMQDCWLQTQLQHYITLSEYLNTYLNIYTLRE